MNKIFLDIREEANVMTEIKTVGSGYVFIVKSPDMGNLEVNLTFEQLDCAIDEMRIYNAEPTFEELEIALEDAKEEIREWENDFYCLRESLC